MASAAICSGLRVDGRENPIGLTNASPRLRWTISSHGVSGGQVAFQVHVFDSESAFSNDDRPIWGTGVVSSADTWLSYHGPALGARKRYFWAVRVWLQHGQHPTPWSELASWEMGLLKGDWHGSWIEPEQDPTYVVSYADGMHASRKRPKPPVDTTVLRPAQHLRREFMVGGRVVRARLYSTAHGIYSASLNGVRLQTGELAPGWTPYNDRLLYQTSDITDLLTPGINAVGFTVADGWWAGRVGMHAVSANYGNRLAVLAQLEIEYDDGRRDVVTSDSEFRSTVAHIRYADLVMGEMHDLRLEQPQWDCPGFADGTWKPVVTVDHPLDVLSADEGGRIEVIDLLPAQRVIRTPDGSAVVDFGQSVTGRIRMVARGAAGTVIRLEHSETLDKEGNLYDNVHALDQTNTDVVVLAGLVDEVFEPRFTFHGFRYVKIVGYPGELDPQDFTAVVLSSATRATTTFECSDERLNRLYQNAEWTLKGSLLGLPMDNPDRERVGWTGDTSVIAETMLRLFDLEQFSESWLSSLRIEQGQDGSVPLVVPFFEGYREWANKTFGVTSCSAWGDVAIILPWSIYQAYGDPTVLEVSYDSMSAWLDWESARAKSSLRPEDMTEGRGHLWRVNQFHLGDWLAPSAQTLDEMNYYTGGAMAKATNPLIPTMFYANSASLMAKTARVLSKPDDQMRFLALAVAIRQSFQSEFMEGDLLRSDRQGDYVLALEFEMVPVAARPKMVGRLVELIHANGDRLDTGFLSTPFLLKTLSDNGYRELAFKLLLSEEDPSWLYQVKRGATTIWEMWNSVLPDGTVTPTSQIQPALSVVSKWMGEAIGGIVATAPGYRRVLISPLATDMLEFGKATVTSVFGQINCAWHRSDEGIELTTQLPLGVSGVVILDGANRDRLVGWGPQGNKLDETEWIADPSGLAVNVGSGTYRFQWQR